MPSILCRLPTGRMPFFSASCGKRDDADEERCRIDAEFDTFSYHNLTLVLESCMCKADEKAKGDAAHMWREQSLHLGVSPMV